jgi:glycosyltransferase involved in cell wall biosynthesis
LSVFSLHIDTARTWRGGQGQVLHTVMGLRARRQRTVLVAHPQGELFRRMSEGMDLIPLAPRNEIDLAASWRLSRVLKQLAPQIIHAHDPHAVAMAATALSIASLTPQPRLVASRRIEFRIGHNSFSKWKYGRVDCFIAISEAVRRRLHGDGIPLQKTTVVHEGVDVERIVNLRPANVHAAFYLPTHAPLVGNIGALVAQKGQHDLIDAAAIVVRAVPDSRFIICGEGELKPALEEQIKRKHLERHVFLAGFRPDVLELLKGFDLFALSSLQEGLCTSLVDAMAASKAAVATHVGGVPEVVANGETGYLVPPRDEKAMADRIIALLRDDARRTRMGEAALKRARAMFTVDRMVEGTLETYERLLGVAVGRQSPRSGH